MADSYWKTGSRVMRREHVAWPTPLQMLGQFGATLLIGVLWAVLLVGYIRLTAEQTEAPLRPAEESVVAVTNPTAAATLQVGQTPIVTEVVATQASPTYTPTPPVEDTRPAPTQTRLPEPTASETASPEPQPSPTPVPTAPEPPPSPTNTPALAEGVSVVSFAGDVLPIFQRRCVNCHGGEKTEEGLVLKSYADVMAGSFNGPVIEPGSAETSYLVEMIASGKMPKRGPHLLPAQIQIIKDWINVGAPDN